ncbi:hypothetical protein [Halorubrum halodurans]|uniref:Uncharacterized protein n=1 Tax=Halorubrum halodurans TaxID=1383851 RepID=A0A256IPN1_9EURY|nr:hypothetical protein [Halorubrum halodurans]OYR58504.1 hypothetical protein DJ70_03010 [Halorubrum halodurans]
MIEFEAINVVVESTGDEYEVTAVNGLNQIETFVAGALNLNGFAFATSSMEIGEYGERIMVTQEENSRYLNLDVYPEEN